MRIFLHVACLALGSGVACFICIIPAEINAQQPKIDPDRAFRRADVNGDGKLSHAEWQRFLESAPKLKEIPRADMIFGYLDANGDGFLDRDEFKRLLELRKKDPPPRVEPKREMPIEKPPSAEHLAFFEKKIRPVLIKECYSCHSAQAEKIKGGLTLDSREAMRKGGDGGPALIPCDAKNSRIIKALKHQSDESAMPPKKKLDDAVVADFERWIAAGAADPREGSAHVHKSDIDIDKAREFWAFRPVRSPKPPRVGDSAWVRGEIDAFLLAAMDAKGVKPVREADAATLVRRLYFDLIGLPPSPEQLEQFIQSYHASTPEQAIAKTVDELLASPRFGERWGRHWLDVARYGESSGRSANFMYPHAWRYRDYVIAAFNADKPYDQFVREQIAGDLLSSFDPKQKAEYLIATGFLAIGPKSHNERSAQQFLLDLADEQIDVTFQAFQGLTVACARCHDHKFDPVPQKDYYALSGIFQSSETCYGTIRVIQNNHPGSLVALPKAANPVSALEPLTQAHRAEIEKQIAELREQLAQTPKDKLGMSIVLRVRIATLEAQITSYEADGTPKALAMGMRDRGVGHDSPLYNRGEIDQPGVKVKRGFPEVMTRRQPLIFNGSGRKELADWIASKENPLTARVMANRIWLHLMGRGIVPTVDNFGASGQTPSNPELLDYLASSFIQNGWSTKKLIRSICLSHAYRLSSEFNESNSEADPEDILIWRMPKRRLEAEAMRDAMLAASGRLDLSPPKGDAVARVGEGNVGFLQRAGGFDAAAEDRHRAVYLPIVRDLTLEVLSLFDFPDPSLIMGERPTTSIPAQSLYLMNSSFVVKEAAHLADRLAALGEDDHARINHVYQICYSRCPTNAETSAAIKFIETYTQKKNRKAAWAALCQALFASAEFSYR